MISGVSGRYATALFDLAREENALDAVAADIAALKKLEPESADLSRALHSPLISRAEQGKVVDALSARAGFNPLTAKFLGLLARNRRLALLQSVIAMFEARLSLHRGQAQAQVTSAKPLSDTQAEAIKKTLRDATKRDVQLDLKVDETLIGGMILRYGSRMIDSSLCTKINNLKLAMKEIG